MERTALGTDYAEINMLAALQFMPGERPYIDRSGSEPDTRELLLHLGCNVLRTAHLARTVIGVLNAMGFEFNAAGGPAHCCGIVHHRNDDPRRARAVVANTMRHFADYGATRVLMLCPSCKEYFDDVVTKDQPVAFSYEPVTAFIARNLVRARFTRRIPRRVALHRHAGHPQSRSDLEDASTILRAIPGLELVDLEVEASSGRHCAGKWIAEAGVDQWRQTIRHFLEAARAARVDAVATIYHSCHREICPEEAHFPFAIVNYLTLLGEAMGIEHPDAYKSWKLRADADAIFNDVRPYVEANGLDPARVRKVLVRAFASGSPSPSKKKGDVPANQRIAQ